MALHGRMRLYVDSYTATGRMEIARECFFELDTKESSIFSDLHGVCRCLRSFVHTCKARFVVLQVDAMNLLGIVDRGNPRLDINELARELL